MTDTFGIPLSIGDKVIYTTGGRGYTYLDTGKIVDIVGTAAKVQSDESGRILTNYRYQGELVSMKPIQECHPELFV